jgi:2-keto-4-pentenoate hydratase/2-oxohepta-3-ene-1,7-dioic acid hydratase in catechol pathway
MMDFEGELGVIIGKRGRYIDKQSAFSYVAGYTCFNDVTIRDWQRHGTVALPGKNFYRSGSCGPWLVTADEVPDPSNLMLTVTLNGEEMQRARTDMIFDIPTLIAYLSAFTPLEPGDVIATGTPSGVGMQRKPPVWLKHGDVIEVTISGLGTLSNPIEDETEI